ncbi:hypothetical protein XI02_42180 [Bradyrhizobium sp. CCBAU 21365]|uniref:hypothetical protein n=1 Tax=Bradyrhizobium sp. CCBAU 21365 TaxID=1325083 RepID=UPI00188D5A6B|nr:hypothetical protein [Bradyrhizobium sp. CCBAU 21365]QOZ20829.1 hypothetical protein XI02_42180 [Bradyrhizobium sp. CCBAU 21365]
MTDQEADRDAFEFALTGVMQLLLEKKLVRVDDLKSFTLDALRSQGEMLTSPNIKATSAENAADAVTRGKGFLRLAASLDNTFLNFRRWYK